MDKKVFLAAIAVMAVFLASNAAAVNVWSNSAIVDVNGAYASQSDASSATTENSVLCVADDGNFQVTIRDAHTYTGIGVTFYGTTNVNNAKAVGLDGNGYKDSNDQNMHVNAAGSATFSVAAPTTEGIYKMTVYDTNAVDTNYYSEWVAVKPDSTYTEFTFKEAGTDANGFCKIINYSTFDGTITDTAGYGQIKTIESNTIDLSGDIDFDAGVNMNTQNKFTFNLSAFKDQKMQVTFKKPQVATSQFQVKRNDSGCSQCSAIESRDGTIVFNVASLNDSLTTYEIAEVPVGGELPEGSGTFVPGSPLSGVNSGFVIFAIIAVVLLIVVAAKRKK